MAIDESTLDFIAEHHADIGSTVLERWKAPPECVELAANHHLQLDVDDLAKRLDAAGRAAVSMGFPGPFTELVPLDLRVDGALLNIHEESDMDKLRREIEQEAR